DCAKVLGRTGTATTTEAVGTLTMTVSADGDDACLLDGRYGLLGDPASVKAALDAHAKRSGVDSVAEYRTARDTLGGDRLLTFFVSGRLYTQIAAMTATIPGSEAPGASPFGASPFGSNPFGIG